MSNSDSPTPLLIFANRRREIDTETALLQARLKELQAELARLDEAERYTAGLLGVARREEGPAVREPSARADRGKPEGTPSVPEMIVEALIDASTGRDTVAALEPKEIREFIAGRYWPHVPAEVPSTIAWRMWKRGQLDKDGPRYMLPEKNEATDDVPDKVASVASDQQPNSAPVEPGEEAGHDISVEDDLYA